MATRSVARFLASEDATVPDAVIYRHWDGYPEGAGSDLIRFLRESRPFGRNGDPTYLAAKYVVWLADLFRKPGAPQLDFISVGVCRDGAMGWLEYIYDVICDGTDRVICRDVNGIIHEIPEPVEPFVLATDAA